MSLEELYKLLKEELQSNLSGRLLFEGSYIKWEYDAFGIDIDDEIEDHLNVIYCDDLELLKEFIDDNFYISEPDIQDTFIFFYIES